MNDNAALNLVKQTFENSFNRERFLIFAKNLFHFLDTDSFIYRGNLIPDAYDSHIKTLERLGKYEDVDGHKIEVLAVCLNKQSALERARTMQRNFIAWYLNGSRGGITKDAALVAFYTKDSDDWRLSLVKMDYHLGESKAGKIKAITELTPARRFSFLVGANENTHTAQRQLLRILKDDEFRPRLADLESAFSVEVVTKDFFEKYTKLFLDTKEALDNIVARDTKIKTDFQEKNIDTTDFAKKLLGQIVFLYFLQKKGWFGVARDAVWGTGPKDFLRRLFEKQNAEYDNFFNNILEPLFYEALAVERPDNFYSRFDCKIPFLNGGLFDPLGNYDWVHTDIRLPDELFSNSRKTKEGDTGDGILDVFDRYNFTVKEDEPLEREVAVDPEMLGKVFENLLEVKDRKSKGTYYTPREIVHYMCQESLINYLLTELDGKVNRDDIETLIRLGETAIEHDKVVLEHGEEKGRYTFKLPQSIRDNANILDEKLEKIRVCDPAVGSGAFLVGMMTEVIRVRSVLTNYLADNGRSIYDFKRHAIQNCLYGVDIDPGAVEIAKLRLWLSLVVDEEDIKQIKPLPNLDYKIMQGNSLLEEFEGVRLFDEELISKPSLDDEEQITAIKQKQNELQREFIKLYSNGGLKGTKKQELELELKKLSDSLKHLSRPEKPKSESGNLFDIFSEAKKKAQELKQLHKEFFEASQKTKKDELKRRIENLEWELIETTLKEENKMSALKQLEQYKKTNVKPFFLWKLHFAEVFERNGKSGFDVVIANPPYVRADSKDPNYQTFRRTLEKSGRYKTLYEKWDLFIPFIERGLNLLNEKGDLNFIVSNAICTSKYAFKLLDLVQENYFVVSVDYFENIQVFDAGVIPVVLHVSKDPINQPVKKIIRNGSFNNVLSEQEYKPDDFKKLGKLAFKKDYHEINIKVPTVNLGAVCYISKGMVLNSDEVTNKGAFAKDDLISAVRTDINIKPYIEGKYLKKYLIEKILFLEWNTKRVPYLLSRPTFPELYNRPKIMRGRVTEGTYDDTGLVCNDSILLFLKFIDLKGVNNNSIAISIQKFNSSPKEELEKVSNDFNLKYLLAILNSKFANVFLNNIRRHRLENYFYPDDFRNLPIAEIPLPEQKRFADLVDKITSLKKSGSENDKRQALDYENQIDQLVYKLYGLTPEEIAVVEKKIP